MRRYINSKINPYGIECCPTKRNFSTSTVSYLNNESNTDGLFLLLPQFVVEFLLIISSAWTLDENKNEIVVEWVRVGREEHLRQLCAMTCPQISIFL